SQRAAGASASPSPSTRCGSNTSQPGARPYAATAASPAAQITARDQARASAASRILCARMPVAHLASRFWERNADVVTAVLAVVLALAVVWVLRKAFDRHARKLAESVMRGELSPETDTRLRLIERLVYALVILLGIAIALSQFDGVKSIGEKVLASGAIAAAIVGFAARQTLANLIAGVLLAITQPIRIGDLVAFEEETGVVEDIQLTYTYLRADDGRRIIIPNERLASSTIENFTIVDPSVEVDVLIGLPLEADPQRALEAVADLGDAEVSAIEKDGFQIVVRSRAEHPVDRREVAARIRAKCLERLRRENILG
ncbi:MAG: hypothetical protein QOI64_1872, partial [Solirubrobacteraceae bacterium]|nr:hypothetical protein [Solirubrobacteraceae bacterium]